MTGIPIICPKERYESVNTRSLKRRAKTIARWTIPPGFQDMIRRAWVKLSLSRQFELQSLLSTNSIFKNIHSGQRCFILGTGPSINSQDLTTLKNEKCISLNSFYLHPDYMTIQPLYHLTSGLTPHPKIGLELGKKWFLEMEEKVGTATLFLNYGDRDYVLRQGIFSKNPVYYCYWEGRWEYILSDGIDITKVVYPGKSVAVVAIQLALYMGFKEIYLLGLDHDWIIRYAERRYTHFYEPHQSILEKSGITDWIEKDWKRWLEDYVELWDQYEILKTLSEKSGATIYNSTAGGLLDVFPLARYESVVSLESTTSKITETEKTSMKDMR
jgi:hypothetical protein